MDAIQMVDLKNQYLKIKTEIDKSIENCLQTAAFIKGPEVSALETNLQNYLNVKKVITCANGTDALQIAMMALDLKAGDEVIVPSFTYVATAEVIGLLGLTPVMVDVDPDTFNITADVLEQALSPKTRAIVPVHLFGQCTDMHPVLEFARKNDLFVIEDTAQAIGAIYTFPDGTKKKAGAMGDVGCTSFFPSKNLGCYGDGGAIYTNNIQLGEKLASLANHGQIKKYVHKYIGVNSRLDSIQAAILNVKLPYLDQYTESRNKAAAYYDNALAGVEQLVIPHRDPHSTHVFHQYTLKVKNNKRDQLLAYLQSKSIPAMIYYPVPLNEQEAYRGIGRVAGSLENTRNLCNSVISLPMHTELTETQLEFITGTVRDFFAKNN